MLPLPNLLCFYSSFSHKVVLLSLAALLKLIHTLARRECSSRAASTIIPESYCSSSLGNGCPEVSHQAAFSLQKHEESLSVSFYGQSLGIFTVVLSPSKFGTVFFALTFCFTTVPLPLNLQCWGAMNTRTVVLFKTSQHTKNVVLKRKWILVFLSFENAYLLQQYHCM